MKKSITYKKMRGTDKEYPHTDVFVKVPTKVGYIMKNQSGDAADVGENWNFCGNGTENFPGFYGKTRQEIVDRLEKGNVRLRAYLVTLDDEGMHPEIETNVSEDYGDDRHFPYGDSVPIAVGSNQTVIVEDMDEWDCVMELVATEGV